MLNHLDLVFKKIQITPKISEKGSPESTPKRRSTKIQLQSLKKYRTSSIPHELHKQEDQKSKSRAKTMISLTLLNPLKENQEHQ